MRAQRSRTRRLRQPLSVLPLPPKRPPMVPAFVVALSCNATTAMVLSQVVLSFVLPLPLVALVVLSSRRSVMGDFVAGKATAVAAVVATILIVLLNVVLIGQIAW
ncbi:MAG TPA: divalent metal cation transporter [Casimicrobiaceae bacterium]|nr:divalent metal cation transporter [Casimicrobiaceae bacterium]